MLKILVVEDHALVREGLVQTLRQLKDGVRVSEAGDCRSACDLLEQDGAFDLVLLDLGLPDVDGLACMGIIRGRFPSIPVVVVSAHDDMHTVNRVLKNGAAGFVPKTYSCDRLLLALCDVLDGQIFSPDTVVPLSDSAFQPAPLGDESVPAEFGLTDRQAAVLALMVTGLSNRRIAERAGLSEGTVKIHVTAIFKALGVSSRTQALLAATRYRIKF